MAYTDGTGDTRFGEVRIICGAAIYFVLVMIAGFALGTLREVAWVPALGRAVGEPLEAP
jgi:hypothetical protein